LHGSRFFRQKTLLIAKKMERRSISKPETTTGKSRARKRVRQWGVVYWGEASRKNYSLRPLLEDNRLSDPIRLGLKLFDIGVSERK